jgi:hypothetical protein
MARLPGEKDASKKEKIELSVPWSGRAFRPMRNTRESDLVDAAASYDFVRIRSALHEVSIKETEKTRRLAMCLSAGLLALPCIIPVFAPARHEVLSYWVGLALFVFSAGSMGYSSITFNSKKLSLKGEGDEAPSPGEKP